MGIGVSIGPGRAIAALVVLVALFGSTLAPAQNLISNPELDTDISNWFFDVETNQQWSAVDSDGCAQSGSFSADSQMTSPGFQYFETRPFDCVAVSPSEILHLALRYKGGGQFIRLYLLYNSDVGCGTNAGSSEFVAVGPVTGSWNTLEGSTVIPASGVAAVFFTVDSSLSSASPFSIQLDRAYLSTVDRVFVEGFEFGSTCRWSLTSS